MLYIIKKHRSLIIIFLVILIGAFFRFYKLDWGEGLYTHPDEYHIVASVNQLSYPDQMHPHFFSYGTVTIYLIYFTKELLNSISQIFNPFLIGRFYSALFSTLTIFLIYKISRAFMDKRFSLLAAFFVAITAGLIQQAHFATPESTLIFFLLLSLLLMIKFLQNNKLLFIVFSSISFGFALGVKISSIVLVLPFILAILFKSYSKNKSHLKSFLKTTLKFSSLLLINIVIAFATFAIVAPYVFLDYKAFKGNVDYEGGLAIGKIPVFYTRQFINTTPVLFQLEKIFPYTLGPSLYIFGILGFIYLIVRIISEIYNNKATKQFNNTLIFILILIIIVLLSLFLPNAFLFAKWTRFIAPTFPFFSIFSAYFLCQLTNKMKTLGYLLSFAVATFSFIWAITFFSIYDNPDVRITASRWLESYLKPGSNILVEGGNTVDLPLNGNFQRISLDFYALEKDILTREKIIDALYSSDYFLVQSRRVFYNHQRLKNFYPKTAKVYDSLFDGNLGFEKIKEFSSFPKLSFFGLKIEFPDEEAEETWSVFDHPVIRVFEKKKQLTREEYARFTE